MKELEEPRDLIKRWNTLNRLAKETIEQERTLRQRICNDIFGEQQGRLNMTENYGGTKVRAKRDLKPKLDNEDELLAAWADMSEEEQELFTQVWNLSSKIRNLPSDSIVWTFVTLHDAMPTLEIVDD